MKKHTLYKFNHISNGVRCYFHIKRNEPGYASGYEIWNFKDFILMALDEKHCQLLAPATSLLFNKLFFHIAFLVTPYTKPRQNR